jgi:Transposase DDE domain
MATSVPQVIAQFKADVGQALSASAIEQACAELKYKYRKRTLDPVTTIHVFLTQILHGNTACTELPHLTGIHFSAPAYTKARSRLPLPLFEKIFNRVTEGLYSEQQASSLWRGHRTWHLDGSNFSMPDLPVLQKAFGQPGNQKKGCGFPVAHILALFHADTGFLQRVIPSPLRTHDMAHASDMVPEMRDGDILIADRGFASFVHLALISKQNRHAIFRCHQRQIVDFRHHRKHKVEGKGPKGIPTSRWIKSLGKHDQLVEYVKPKTKPKWMDQSEFDALPETMVVRELRFTIKEKGCRTQKITIVTTLLDPILYPAHEIAKLYRLRWGIETNLRHLKTTMKMEVLHCTTVKGILKELAMYALVYNLVRLVMLEAGRRQDLPAERISFYDALRWLRTAKPGTPLSTLVVIPHRPKRHEPRVVKRRPKQYSRMTKPRDQMRKALQKKVLKA